MKNKFILVVVLLVAAIIGAFSVKLMYSSDPTIIPDVTDTGNFTIDLLKRVNNEKNYLISPYSIEVALSMLKTGADNKTREEIDKVLPQRDLNVSNENVKISNAIFVKNVYKDVIEKSFEKELKNNYKSTILYDEFRTPKVINDWVKKSTDGMIEKILDSIDEDFVLGLANAIAIDAKWVSEFECNNTISEKFTKSDNKKINVEMMHRQYRDNIEYANGDVEGVIIPYQENLEFIALLPKDNLKNYINNLTNEDLNKVLNSFKKLSENERLNLSLPRFSYKYNINNFIGILNDMGITSAFDPVEADFSKIITKENLNKLGKDNLYVSDAIHKTYIDLNEKGTKAAAVTYFGIKTSGAYMEDYKEIDIKFNRPFMYIIRDTETKEILFIGSVYEPNEWKGTTCSNKD